VKLTKGQSRERWRQLHDLACEWDPIGVISIGAGRDEYDCLLGPLLRLLEDNADEDALFHYLDLQMRDHFGLLYVPSTRSFASKVKSWYEQSWPGSSVQNGLAE
jgi:hypothetical protein